MFEWYFLFRISLTILIAFLFSDLCFCSSSDVVTRSLFSPSGHQPLSQLALHSDGYLYSIARGGAYGDGVVFRVQQGAASTSAAINTLAQPVCSLQGYSVDSNFNSPLLSHPNGLLYGVATLGGQHGFGSVYEVSPLTGVCRALAHFEGGAYGSYPMGGLAMRTDGALIGATLYGGTIGSGVLYKLILPSVAGQASISVLRSFALTDGNTPAGPLLALADGSVVGINMYGGVAESGALYRYSSTGVFTLIVSFDPVRAAHPTGNLLLHSNGRIYGTCAGGGNKHGGAVFSVDPDGSGFKKYDFFNSTGDFHESYSGLSMLSGGNMIGTAHLGGLYGYGGVFIVTPLGNLTQMAHFKENTFPLGVQYYSSDLFIGVSTLGKYPETDDRNMYISLGYLFTINLNTSALTILYQFTSNFGTGSCPSAALTSQPDGTWLTTTKTGGTFNRGLIIKVTANLTIHTFYTFSGPPLDGANPSSPLLFFSDGFYYGTTEGGGTADLGTLYRISQTGVITLLHSFLGADGDGLHPSSALTVGLDGLSLFGSTDADGFVSYGTVFQFTPSTAEYRVLSSDFWSDHQSSVSALAVHPNGYLYGSQSRGYCCTSDNGMFFSIDPANNAKPMQIIHELISYEGMSPKGKFLVQPDGSLLGSTSWLGSTLWKKGTIFRLFTNGSMITLAEFGSGSQEGYGVVSSLLQSSDGYFYGTTQYGCEANGGSVFRFNLTSGEILHLHCWTVEQGIHSEAGLVSDGADGLFGTTTSGGVGGLGSIFRVSTNARQEPLTLPPSHDQSNGADNFPLVFFILIGIFSVLLIVVIFYIYRQYRPHTSLPPSASSSDRVRQGSHELIVANPILPYSDELNRQNQI